MMINIYPYNAHISPNRCVVGVHVYVHIIMYNNVTGSWCILFLGIQEGAQRSRSLHVYLWWLTGREATCRHGHIIVLFKNLDNERHHDFDASFSVVILEISVFVQNYICTFLHRVNNQFKCAKVQDKIY